MNKSDPDWRFLSGSAVLRSILIAALIAASLVWSVGRGSASSSTHFPGAEQTFAVAVEASAPAELAGYIHGLPDSANDLHEHCAHASWVFVISASHPIPTPPQSETIQFPRCTFLCSLHPKPFSRPPKA
jgi:hypothetical protein